MALDKYINLCLALALGAGLFGCDDRATYTWDLPSGFPEPRVPADNPMSDEKVELGRFLFYDTRLSGNETQSCGSCHFQELAFTDARATSIGSTGEHTGRGSMTLANVAYAPTLTWANPALVTLEMQALVPMFGEVPVELGLTGMEQVLVDRLSADQRYVEMFAAAFPDESDPITVSNVVKAIASFQRALISGNSAYDRYQRGDRSAMSDSAVRGMELFFSERLECFHCHGGFTLSSAVDHSNNVFDQSSFENNGLYNVDGIGGYPASNTGLYEHTGDRRDMGRFKPPTLRNIAVTAPYMHDGSIATLEEVVAHYAAGGRNIESGPNAGDGRDSPNKNGFIAGFIATQQELDDIVAFLEALTDDEFLTDPRFSDPFAP